MEMFNSRNNDDMQADTNTRQSKKEAAKAKKQAAKDKKANKGQISKPPAQKMTPCLAIDCGNVISITDTDTCGGS
jgi:hypothetical protein